jgi:hypothetical protein
MTVSLSKGLLKIVDTRRKVNRAQFIREAIAEKLASMGIEVPGEVMAVPDRAKQGQDDLAPPANGDAGSHSVNDKDAKAPKLRTSINYDKPKRTKKRA